MPAAADPLRAALQLQRAADRRTIEVMRAALRDMDAQLKALEQSGKIGAAVRRVQLAGARQAILRAMLHAWARLGNVIETQAAAAALAAAAANAKYDRAILRRLGMSDKQIAAYQRQLAASAERAVGLALNRAFDTTGSTNRALSERVYGSRAVAENYVARRIESGLARGLSAREMAREIRGLVRPDVPGGVSYAAKRLARTEINNAFHFAQIENSKNKPWINGMKWELSGSHPKPDACDQISKGSSKGLPTGQYRPEDVPPKPHPQCLCFLVPVTMSTAEFERALKGGAFDSWAENNLPK